jgi:hypothetical protein
MKKTIMALAAAATLASGVAAAPAPLGTEARIPFVHLNSIRDFEAVGRDTLYIQDRRRNWYKASLFGPCFGLNFAHRIGVRAWGGSLDRFGEILVDGDSCKISSLVTSEAPPQKEKRS